MIWKQEMKQQQRSESFGGNFIQIFSWLDSSRLRFLDITEKCIWYQRQGQIYFNIYVINDRRFAWVACVMTLWDLTIVLSDESLTSVELYEKKNYHRHLHDTSWLGPWHWLRRPICLHGAVITKSGPGPADVKTKGSHELWALEIRQTIADKLRW